MIAFTKAAAIEYGAKGIRANAICPGLHRDRDVGRREAQSRSSPRWWRAAPMRRAGQPEEVAELPSFLASDRAPLHHRRGHPDRRRHHRHHALTGDTDDDHRPTPSVYYDPYDVDINADPYPTLRPPPRRGADLLQRALRLLGAVAPRRRREGARQLADVLEHPQRHPRHHQGRRRAAAGRDPVRGPAAAHDAPRASCRGCSRRGAWPRSRTRCAQFCVGCLDPLVGSERVRHRRRARRR